MIAPLITSFKGLYHRAFVLCSLFVAVCLYSVSCLHADTNIGYVDVDRVMQNAKPFKDANKVLNTKRDEFEAELIDLEKKLSKENEKLVALQKSKPDEFQKAYKFFQKKLREAHEKLDVRKKTLRAIHDTEHGRAQRSFEKAVKVIAKKKSLDLVLSSSVLSQSLVLFAKKKLDVTNVIISYLNKD